MKVQRSLAHLVRTIGCSAGNVFEYLGFDREAAENLRIRADLMIELRELIRRKRLTHA